jgi:hypothetical protein
MRGRHYRERTVPFSAGDGFALNLVHVRGEREPSRGPVLLIHGAGVRANIFRAPVPETIVDALIARGYDVWLENWRASIDLPPNHWTLDQAALHDHPQAVRKVVEETGAERIKAIVHCQGSTSFTMSAVAGLVPEVDTIVSNAVSLHPQVPRWSRIKLRLALPLLKLMTPYLNPAWGLSAPHLPAKLITWLVRRTHRECRNDVCRHVSFTYGSGFPALWNHENLDDETHEWLKHEFAHVPLRFFSQIARCVASGHLVAVEGYPALPGDFCAKPPRSQARFAFIAGQDNRCFLAASQVASYEYFDALRPGFHSLRVLPGYSHLDVFMGRNAARDTFPLILDELERRDEASPTPGGGSAAREEGRPPVG